MKIIKILLKFLFVMKKNAIMLTKIGINYAEKNI